MQIFKFFLFFCFHSTSQPLFLGGLVSYFSEEEDDVSRTQAYLYAMGIVLCSLVGTLCYHPFMFYLFELGTRIRIACSGLVYRKCLRVSVTADNSGMSGFAISLLSSDLSKFDMTLQFFHNLWKGPIECCIFGYIMYRVIGWPAIVGIATIIVFLPFQAWVAKSAAHYRHEFAEYADDRVKLMNEILMAIKVIKMYAWEKSFAKLIAIIRKKELKAVKGSMRIFAALQCTEMISVLALFLSMIAYVYNGQLVTAQKVFIISSYYNVLNDSLMHFWPKAVTTWAETFVCARRVVEFLLQSEDPADGGIENIGVDLEEKGNFSGRVHNTRAIRKSVILHKLSASWDKVDSEKRCKHIEDISFHIAENQFVGIVGTVGSGKTTLLNVILGELEILHGNVEINGVVSYTPQEAWIFEDTIRNNILFVEKYDEQRYKAVIQACELERDFELLPHGDSTFAGERGISLSGGQKARIGLARAVYKQADIYVFDDPLSSVDAEEGKLLRDKCIMNFLQDKIRILVTHRLQHLKDTDHLILMKGGRADVQGCYAELKNLKDFRAYLEHETDEIRRMSLMHLDSVVETDTNANQIQKTVDKGADRKELILRGKVKLRTYVSYFQTAGIPCLVILIFAIFILARVCQSAMDVFIAKW